MTKISCKARRKIRRGGGFRRGWEQQRSEQDVGRDKITGMKDPVAPDAKDIVAKKDG